MKDIQTIFDTIIGKDRLAHLYLFIGAQGVQKRHMAYEIAVKIMTQGLENPEIIKHQIVSENHPNLLYIAKDGDAIKKEQIIELQKEFTKTSLVPGPRVYIIDGVDALTVSAANSLLKFMEEPQGVQTVGLLLTDQKTKVLPTIISRSQVMILPTALDFEQSLISDDILEDDAKLLAFLTQDKEEAKTLLQESAFIQTKQLTYTFLESWFNKDISLVLLIKEQGQFLYSDKKWYALFLNILMRYFLDLIEKHLNQTPTLTFLETYLAVHVNQLSIKKCEKMIKEIQKLLNKIPYYINLELGLEVLLFEFEKNR